MDDAPSGEEALNCPAGKALDLIITDFHMPDAVDGQNLIGEARRRCAGVPVILMTGRGSAKLQARAVTVEVNHYMKKPFDIDRLLAIAGQLLRPQ